MEIKELNEEVKNLQVKLIKKVLDGESEEETIPYVRPSTIIELIQGITGEKGVREDFDSNGWEWDYSAYITIKDVTYRVSGDAYFSDSCSFSIDN